MTTEQLQKMVEWLEQFNRRLFIFSAMIVFLGFIVIAGKAIHFLIMPEHPVIAYILGYLLVNFIGCILFIIKLNTIKTQ